MFIRLPDTFPLITSFEHEKFSSVSPTKPYDCQSYAKENTEINSKKRLMIMKNIFFLCEIIKVV